MLYKWLIDQIARIANEERHAHAHKTGEHVDPLRWQVHFGVGAVERLAERLAEKRRRQSDAAGTALAIHHGCEVSDYLEARYGYRRDGRETKRERERREKQEKREQEMQDLLRRDPEAYYRHRPWERPKTEEQKVEAEKASAKYWAKWEAKERRNAARRRGRAWRPESDEARSKRLQGEAATDAGRVGADRINLEPFIDGKREQEEPRRIN